MTDKLLEELRQADPVDRDAIRRRPAPEADLESILATERPRQRRRQAVRRPLATRLALAAGVSAALIAIVAAALPGEDGPAESEAAAALNSVAAVASSATAPVAEDGIVYYRWRRADLSTVGDRPPYSWLMPETVEQWVAPDGSGRIRTVDHRPEFLGPRDERRWRESGGPALPGRSVSDEAYGPGGLTDVPYEAQLPPVRELPTDPDRLIEIFEEEAGRSSASVPTNAKTFEYATSVLLHAGSSAELRAALYRVVAQVDGVTLAGDVRDPLGRPGTGVSLVTTYSGGPERLTLVFDPKTSQPLAFTERFLEPEPFADGDLFGYTVLEQSGPVPDTRSRPEGPGR